MLYIVLNIGYNVVILFVFQQLISKVLVGEGLQFARPAFRSDLSKQAMRVQSWAELDEELDSIITPPIVRTFAFH